MNSKDFYIEISLKAVIKRTSIFMFVMLALLFIINRFQINSFFYLYSIFFLLGAILNNIMFSKNFKIATRNCEISLYFLPSIKWKILLDEISKIKIHYNIGVKDRPLIIFHYSNRKSKSFAFSYLKRSDVDELAEYLRKEGLKVEVD
ncbi:MAG: hypothetical protein H6538_00770 [Bacteroidales bacterium]|nr:hypothetical protein [Bacteroidales bacterium]MCB9012574.1 hypothetical protein [Bacteroidales bacterium]